jgi:hypothetical protein
MNHDKLRRSIRCYPSAIAIMALASFASAQTSYPCNTSDPAHPREKSCVDANCATPVGASCWGPQGASWANGTTYASGEIRVTNGVRKIRAYAYGALEGLAGGDDFYAYVWSVVPGTNVSSQCNTGFNYLLDDAADQQWTEMNCSQTTNIRVLAYYF